MSQLQSCHRVLWLLDYGGRTLNPGDVQREDPRRLPRVEGLSPKPLLHAPIVV